MCRRQPVCGGACSGPKTGAGGPHDRVATRDAHGAGTGSPAASVRPAARAERASRRSASSCVVSGAAGMTSASTEERRRSRAMAAAACLAVTTDFSVDHEA
eukprot:scaffold10130_cov97-Isochrysis_galbana.AAC.3